MTKLALYVANGAIGATHYADSAFYYDFVVGKSLWLSFKAKATRISGTKTCVVRGECRWYNSAGTELTSTYDEITVDASFDYQFYEFKHTPPANAVKGSCRFKITPSSSPMVHDVWVKDVRLGKTELFATAGAQAGSNLKDSNGNLLGDTDVNNAYNSSQAQSTRSLFANQSFDLVVPGSVPARPQGVIFQNSTGTVDFSQYLAYVNGVIGGDLAIGEGTDATSGRAYFPLWLCNPKAQYRVRGRTKGNLSITDGFYVRFLELDSTPLASKHFMVLGGTLPGDTTQVVATRNRQGGTTALTGGTSIENAPLTASYQSFDILVTPTSSAKFMGLAIYHNVPADRDIHLESLVIEELTPTDLAGLDSTADTKLGGIAAGATVGAAWGDNVSGRPPELTDGRIPLAITSTGRLYSTTVLPPIQGAGQTYNYTGTITYTITAGTPATCDITVGAGNVVMGSTSISYNQMTAQLTGTGGNTQPKTYLYVQTNPYVAGAHTLLSTTNRNTIFSNDNNVFIGYIDSFIYPITGSSSGGGAPGDGCPSAEAFVHTNRGWIKAKDVVPGDRVLCLNSDGHGADDWVEVTANEPHVEPCYLIYGRHSLVQVTVSHSTPITLRDGSVIKVADIDGHELPFEGDGRFWWEPCEITPLEPRPVCKIKCDNRTYSAGDMMGWGILTHNPKP